MSSILIYRIGSIGDAVVALPAFYSIFEAHAEKKIILLSTLSKINPKNSVKYLLGRYFPFYDFIDYFGGQGLIGSLRLCHRIRKSNCEILYYLSPIRDSFIQIIRDYLFFRVLCSIKIIHGFESSFAKYRGSANPVINEVSRILRIVNQQPVENFIPIKPIILNEEVISIHKIIASLNIKKGDFLFGICPGSKMHSKRWPLGRYIEVGRRLKQEVNAKFIILGDESEEEIASMLQSGLGECAVSCAGLTSIFESSGLIAMCDLYIGNDTGVMHLAAAFGVPCVANFSARDNPGKWNPMGNNNKILRSEIECAGCMLEICPNNNACLNAISVDNVHNAASGLLKKIRPKSLFLE